MGWGKVTGFAMWIGLAGAFLTSGAPGQLPRGTPPPPPLPEVASPPGLPVEVPPPLPAGPPTRDRTYQSVTVPGGAKGLRERFTAEQLALLEKLNRRDVPHLARAESLIVPTEWLPDELLYSPLPGTWEWAAAYPKALVVDQASQTFGGYELGRLVRWGPVSSGRKSRPTPSGLFHLNWRSKGRRSTDNPDWYMPWYFNFHAGRGLAFHQLELPGRPASHACVRLLERDAIWLYGWGKGWSFDENRRAVPGSGTPVLILGTYDFDTPPLWLSLDWLAQGIELPAQLEPATALGH